MIKIEIHRTKMIDIGSINIPKQLMGVLNIVALDVETNAKTLAPYKTGNLKNSIKTRENSKYSYTVFTNVHYAGYQEFGTVKMSAHPYMRPAAQMVAVKLGAMIRQNVKF